MSATADPAGNPARILRHRYILALSIIVLLVILNQTFIQVTLTKNDDDSRVINISGRQRMLSQKITKLGRQFLDAPTQAARASLAADLEASASLWEKSHDGLLKGDVELGLRGHKSAATLAVFGQIEGPYRAILGAAHELTRKPLPQMEIQALVGRMEQNEGVFLAGMNAITFQYDKETHDWVRLISLLEYIMLGVTCLVLSLEVFFIFLPAERQIRRSFNDMKKELVNREHTELALRKLTRAVEQSPASIVITDLDGRIEYANPAFARITGYSLEESIGKTTGILKTDLTLPGTHRHLWETLHAGNEWRGEFVNRKKDGSIYYESAIISPVTDMYGATTQFLAVKEDITERKRSEEKLAQAFKENRELLRELQHRVKNSFNMISSMIHLASGEGGSPETDAALEQLDVRVLSVAELYSLLYSSGSFAEVRLDEYCGKLASALLGLRSDISLVTEMGKMVVSANRAAPIGLILTELITNSLKYAFPDNRKGTITVSLRNRAGKAILEVGDDGKGLPEGFSPTGNSGMGLKLVLGLTSQVGGTFAIAGGEGGTSCTLEFAAEVV